GRQAGRPGRARRRPNLRPGRLRPRPPGRQGRPARRPRRPARPRLSDRKSAVTPGYGSGPPGWVTARSFELVTGPAVGVGEARLPDVATGPALGLGTARPSELATGPPRRVGGSSLAGRGYV